MIQNLGNRDKEVIWTKHGRKRKLEDIMHGVKIVGI